MTLWLDLPSIFPLHHWKFYCLPFEAEIRFYSSSNKWWILSVFRLTTVLVCCQCLVCAVQISFGNKKKNMEYMNKKPKQNTKLIAIQTISKYCVRMCVRNLIWFHFGLVTVSLWYTFIARFRNIVVFRLCLLYAYRLSFWPILYYAIFVSNGLSLISNFLKWMKNEHLGKVSCIPYPVSNRSIKHHIYHKYIEYFTTRHLMCVWCDIFYIFHFSVFSCVFHVLRGI